MTINDFHKNYDIIRAELAQEQGRDSKARVELLFRQLDFTLIQINAFLNAAPSIR